MTRFDELQSKLNDLRFLEDEKIGLEHELRESRSMNHDLSRRNEELEARLEKALLERDKMQAFAINIVTRLQVIGENVANVIAEAGRAAISTAGRLQEQRKEAERISAPRPPLRAVAEPQPAPAPIEPPAQPQPRPPREIAGEEPDEHLTNLMSRLTTQLPPMRY